MSKPKRRPCGRCGRPLYPRDLIHVDRIGWCPECADRRLAALSRSPDPAAQRYVDQLADAIAAFRGER